MFLVVKEVERTSFASLRHRKAYFSAIHGYKNMHPNAFNVLCFTISDNEKFVFCLGTWQTYIVKDQDVWHKINQDSPMEYAATITVNPLTALKMLEDFVTLNSGTVFLILVLYSFTGLTLTSLV